MRHPAPDAPTADAPTADAPTTDAPTAEGRNFTCVWEFGPPGHGKGVWDGIAAWMKRTVRRDITDNNVLTETKVILSPRQVGEHLKATFMTEQFLDEHKNKTIKMVVVQYVDATQVCVYGCVLVYRCMGVYEYMAVYDCIPHLTL